MNGNHFAGTVEIGKMAMIVEVGKVDVVVP